MRVLVVTQYFWPENFRINDLVAELVRRGHDVTVVTGVPNYPTGIVYPDYLAEKSRFNVFCGAAVIRVPIVPRGRGVISLILNYLSFAASASVVGTWRLRRLGVDVIFVFEPSPVTVGLPALLFRRTKNARMAFWVLDQWPETLAAVGAIRSRFLLSIVGGLVSFIYRRCDLLLAQSRSFIPHIQKYAGPGTRVEYFPSWSDSVADADTHDEVLEIPRRSGVFTVLFAGNVGEAQDFPAILAAAELLSSRKDIRWVVVGDGRHLEWVRKEVSRRGLGESVALLGRYPLERMPAFFSRADALLVSLRADPVFSLTIPGKVQSYLAAGRPIVGMLDGEGADLIRRAGAGLVCAAGDSVGLAKNIETLASMPADTRAQMARNGVALSDSEFDRGVLMATLDDWLKELQR
jgi:colanic acid biosynthesis glycosyl transferase WcaI